MAVLHSRDTQGSDKGHNGFYFVDFFSQGVQDLVTGTLRNLGSSDLDISLVVFSNFFYSLFSVLLSEEAFVPLFAVLLELASVVPQLVAELVSLLEFLEFVKLERLIHSEDGLVAAESLDSVKRDLEFLGDLRKFKKSVVLMSSGALETVNADQILE